MQKKLLAVAVAGALVAPAAYAQTSVTISGVLNLWWESQAATGATVGSAGDVLSRDRIQDGAGSNIRFTVVEDLGGGMQAFGQVESAVFNNADTRPNTVTGAGSATAVGGWGTRNSGVGLRSSAWGEVLFGVWDVHYQEAWGVDDFILTGTSTSNTLGVTNTLGTQGNMSANPTFGGRLNNVIRYQSPSWSGFNFRAIYSRPTDGVVTNAPGLVTDNQKQRVYNFVPNYSNGPITVGWSHLQDKDAITTTAPAFFAGAALTSPTATPAFGANNVWKMKSDKVFGAYTFPMGFKVGFIWDRSSVDISSGGAAGSATNASSIKRDSWAIPLSYRTGPHGIWFTYAKAKSWKGNINGTDVGSITATTANGSTGNLGSDTGARQIMIGYQYALSKRTNVHVSYVSIRNDALGGYDTFSDSTGMSNGTYGADPRAYGIGLRHAF